MLLKLMAVTVSFFFPLKILKTGNFREIFRKVKKKKNRIQASNLISCTHEGVLTNWLHPFYHNAWQLFPWRCINNWLHPFYHNAWQLFPWRCINNWLHPFYHNAWQLFPWRCLNQLTPPFLSQCLTAVSMKVYQPTTATLSSTVPTLSITMSDSCFHEGVSTNHHYPF